MDVSDVVSVVEVELEVVLSDVVLDVILSDVLEVVLSDVEVEVVLSVLELVVVDVVCVSPQGFEVKTNTAGMGVSEKPW